MQNKLKKANMIHLLRFIGFTPQPYFDINNIKKANDLNLNDLKKVTGFSLIIFFYSLSTVIGKLYDFYVTLIFIVEMQKV
jgi:hypothetical protein